MRDSSCRKPSPGIGDLDAQFQCRLFRLVQALIFGVPASSLEPGGIGRFLVPTTAGFGTLVGRGAVVDLLPGRERRPRKFS